ncbi:MAG: arsenate reductase ArsC [Thermoplasmata archaeon]
MIRSRSRRYRVAFVCTKNSCRSQMAEAFARELAPDVIDPLSAGTEPAKEVDPRAIEVMREVGIDISDAKPKALAPEETADLDLVVHMGCGSQRCMVVPGVPTEEWQIEDPEGKGIDAYRAVRELVRTHVVGLAERLRARAPDDVGDAAAELLTLRLT